MKQLSTVIKIVKVVLKYGVIITAIIKGIEVVYNEIKDLDLDDKTTLENDK
jgi:hypothetical protein